MALVPFAYNVRSLLVRRSSTFLTVLGIGATVAVVAGVLALQQGFDTLFTQNGRDDVVVFLRPGTTSEGESAFSRENARILMNSVPEIATTPEGVPMASAEAFLAVRRHKIAGGETNVPVRGVQPMSFTLLRDRFRIIEGRNLTPGSDEVIVGKKLVDRIRDCRLGDVIMMNTAPCRVVGVFECEGPFESEIWFDVERMLDALERPVFSRVIARLKDTSPAAVEALSERMKSDVQTPCDVFTERQYLENQTGALSGTLKSLGFFLGLIMGIAAMFTATNTMLAAIASRTHEIGILLATGFRPFAIFASFLFEALLLGLLGGLVGCLMTLPVNGIETGTSNFQTFTDVAFAFRVTPTVLVVAVAFSLMLGLAGGLVPAWRAARMTPTVALRRT